MTDLLPCPFCGPEGNPELHECTVGPLKNGIRAWFCKCTTCDIELDLSNSPDAATARWNSRPAQPQSLTGCLHPIGPLSCQNHGKCQSVACNHYGKTWYGPRMTLEAQVDGILYPAKEMT